MKINWKSVFGGAAAIVGTLAANPAGLPHNVATAVTVLGVLLAAFSGNAVSRAS